MAFSHFLISPTIRIIIKFTSFGKSQLEKDFKYYKWAKYFGIEEKRDDFNYCYLQTIYVLLNDKAKNKSLIKLFEVKEVENAFKTEIYKGISSSFYNTLDEHLHTNSKLRSLKNHFVDIKNELEDFKQEFQKVVRETRKPKEIEDVNKLEQIQQSLERLEEGNLRVFKDSLLEDLQFPKDLISSYNPEKAFDFLQTFKKNKWEKIDSELKYKVLANMGICKLHMNYEPDAATFFIDALKFNPNDSKALGFAAIGYSIQNDTEKAQESAELSLKGNVEDQNSWFALLEISNAPDEFKNILERIPDSLKKTPTIAYAIYKKYKNQGDPKAAENYLIEALKADSDRDPQLLATIGTVFLEEIRDPLLLKTHQLTNDFQKKLNEGVSLLSEAINKIKDTDIRKYRWWWYVNRGIAKKFLSDPNGALLDMQTAYELNPKDYFTIRHLAICLIENHDHKEALKYFEKLKMLNPSDELVEIAISECLFHLNDIKKAEEKLKSLSASSKDARIKQEALSLLIKLESKIKNFPEAETLAQNQIKDNESNLIGYLDSAFVFFEKNDPSSAREALLKGHSQIKPETEARIILEFAERLFQVKEFKLASELYSRITDTSLFTPINQKLLSSYLYSGNLDKVLETARKIRESQGLITSVVEMESYVYETIGDLDSAIKICEECLSVEQTYPILARLANLYYRKEEPEKTKNILSLIDDYSQYPTELQFRLAFLNSWVGKVDEALEIAYNARRNDYSNGQTHLNFIQLGFLLKPDIDKLLYPKQTAIDTTLTILDENDNHLPFTILNMEDVYPERGEIYFDSETGKKLLNKSIGDVIVLEKDLGPAQRYTIHSIVHKYISAHRESYDLLATKFISTDGVIIVNLKQDLEDKSKYLKPLTDIVDARQKFDNQIHEFYKSGSLPLGSIASFRKQNPIEVWGWLMSEDFGFISAAAIPNEYQIAIQRLSKEKALILDITSLLTLSELKALETLKSLTLQLNIANSTLDVLKEEIRQTESRSETGYSTVMKVNGQYYRNDITKEMINRNIAYLKQLLKWATENCTILPCHKILSLTENEREHNFRLFGQSFFETILIAADKSLVLLSDDGVLRSYAYQEHAVNGVSSSSILHQAFSKGILTPDTFNRSIVRLYSLGYNGLYINSKMLWIGYEESKFQINRPFSQMLPMLSGQQIRDNRIIALIVSEFLYEVYTRIPHHESQDFICNVIIQYSSSFRNPLYVVLLVEILKNKFKLLPNELKRVFLNIQQQIQN